MLKGRHMKRSQQDLIRISDEASYWVIRLEHDDSAQAQAQFDKWLRLGGPQRFDEFWKAHLAWSSFDQLDRTYSLGAPDPEEKVVDFRGQRADESAPLEMSFAEGEITQPTAVPRRRFAWGIGLAASILMAIGAITLLPSLPFGSEVYATTIGSQQSIKLEDGSIIRLNTHSRVKVRFSEHVREIRLADGEALFTVAHDPARPFIVITDSARVRAVGTQFNVYQAEPGATRVSVLDGVVQVTTTDTHPSASLPPEVRREAEAKEASELSGGAAAIRLAAGDEAVVREGKVVRAATPDVRRAVAWQDRQLVFNGDRIGYIAEQFNRYNSTQIRVEGALAERRMGGTFDVDDPMPMVRYLARDPHVEVIKTDSQIVIRRRDAAPETP
jgi:transmembrane sensor